jgi:hypothetical protein
MSFGILPGFMWGMRLKANVEQTGEARRSADGKEAGEPGERAPDVCFETRPPRIVIIEPAGGPLVQADDGDACEQSR